MGFEPTTSDTQCLSIEPAGATAVAAIKTGMNTHVKTPTELRNTIYIRLYAAGALNTDSGGASSGVPPSVTRWQHHIQTALAATAVRSRPISVRGRIGGKVTSP